MPNAGSSIPLHDIPLLKGCVGYPDRDGSMNYAGLTESSHPRQDNSYCCQLRADPIVRPTIVALGSRPNIAGWLRCH